MSVEETEVLNLVVSQQVRVVRGNVSGGDRSPKSGSIPNK